MQIFRSLKMFAQNLARYYCTQLVSLEKRAFILHFIWWRKSKAKVEAVHACLLLVGKINVNNKKYFFLCKAQVLSICKLIKLVRLCGIHFSSTQSLKRKTGPTNICWSSIFLMVYLIWLCSHCFTEKTVELEKYNIVLTRLI